jgi:hypothetical protein
LQHNQEKPLGLKHVTVLKLTGIDSLRKSRVSVPGVDGSSPAKKSIKQQLATIRTPWLPSSELSTAIVPLG